MWIALTVVLLLLLANLAANARYGRLRLATPHGALPSADGGPAGREVSILIPARNEERRIADCLDSLLARNDPQFEVIVLDDASSDRTGEIVANIAAQDPRLTLVRGAPLPDGWSGKNYACQQLAERASGDWLLFTDADVRLDPAVVPAAVAVAEREQLSLLSGIPAHDAASRFVRWVLGPMYTFIGTGMPFWWVQGSRRRGAGLAMGQFLLFRAEDYHAIGGHAAVRSESCEDVALGLRVLSTGRRSRFVDLTRWVRCDMYDSAGEALQGMVRWFQSLAGIHVPLLLAIIAAATVVYFLPLVAPAIVAATGGASTSSAALGAALAVALRIGADRLFGRRLRSAWSHPFAVLWWIACGTAGTARRMAGFSLQWRDRSYADSDRAVLGGWFRIRWRDFWVAVRETRQHPSDPLPALRLQHALGGYDNEWLYRRMREDPRGAALLDQKMPLPMRLARREELRRLPSGTLGREYERFLEQCAVSPEKLVEAIGMADLDATREEYHSLRRHQVYVHDLWHVVTGYDCDVLGEVGILFFSYAQTRNRGFASLGLLMALSAFIRGRFSVVRIVLDGRRRGERTQFLTTVEWDELLDQPLSDVRKLLGVPPLRDYRPMPLGEVS